MINETFRDIYKRLKQIPDTYDVGMSIQVYDEVAPPGTFSPYLVISGISSSDGRLLNNSESHIRFSIHIWSDKFSKSEVYTLKEQIYDVLEPKYDFIDFQCYRDTESKWYHGIMSFEIYV